MRKSTLAQLSLGLALAAAATFAAQGCGDDDNPNNPNNDAGADTSSGGNGDGGDGGANGPSAKLPSRGSAIALSEDDSVLVSVNRDVGSVSVFAVEYPADGTAATLSKKGEVPVGAEPWQVVIGPDNNTAYVVVRKDQKLVKIGNLKTAPAVTGSVQVGSEPTGVALVPSGTRAWVANWVDGTLMGVDTQTMKVGSTIDLNAELVKSGLLGPEAKARPSLSHPRSVAITNNANGVDEDDSIVVTEYYAQHTEKVSATGDNADRAKTGLVYKIKLLDKSVTAIRIKPLADIGFKDSAGGTAGCFPNQLQSVSVAGNFAYVTSVCASPKGPIGVVTTVAPPDVSNVKTTTHGVVSVVDLTKDAEVDAATASLHARFDRLFADKSIADDATRRYPATPVDMAFVPGQGVGYVVANGTDTVFRVRYDLAAASAITEVGASTQPFIDLQPAAFTAEQKGQNPIGMVVSNTGKKFAFVANDVSRNVSVIDLNEQRAIPERTTASAALPADGSPEKVRLLGKRFFNTALGRWSLKGQGWTGCQACHMDGYSDNVSWFFARGPRQSTSLDGSFSKKDPTDQRLFNWTAIFDEVADFEGNTRGVSGGVGAIVKDKALDVANRIDTANVEGNNHGGLFGGVEDVADTKNPLGLAEPSVLDDWADIKAYIQAIRPPRAATNLDAAKVAAGKALFASDGSCQGCHGGNKWTISTRFHAPSVDKSAGLLTTVWAPPAGFPAALLPAATPANRFMRFQNGNAAAFDQFQCILRPVGTFDKSDNVTGILEKRQDMTTASQGNQTDGNGFNPPSLFGTALGAPYLHGGQAATLESLFSTTFAAHYQALAPNFLADADPAVRAQKVDQLVQYLLSIDEGTATVGIPNAGAGGGNFCAP